MVILGIDPGSHHIGYGLIKKQKGISSVVDYGLLKFSEDPLSNLKKIHKEIDLLIKKHKPDIFAIEQLFYFKNQKTFIQVSQSRGAILLAALKHNLQIIELTPLQVKQSVTGSGRADKAAVARMVIMILKLSESPKPDDVSDALAIALTGAQVASNVIPTSP